MQHEPQKLITRLLEFAAIFCLSAFLLRLGANYLAEVWHILLIVAVVVIAAVVAYRIWQHNRWQ